MLFFFLQKNGQNVYGSALKIKNLEVTDKAEYECVASNGVNKIKSVGVLTVLPEKWSESCLQVTYRVSHNSIGFRCLVYA